MNNLVVFVSFVFKLVILWSGTGQESNNNRIWSSSLKLYRVKKELRCATSLIIRGFILHFVIMLTYHHVLQIRKVYAGLQPGVSFVNILLRRVSQF